MGAILHGASASPFVRKVRVALAEKGIPYEHDPVVPFNISADYRKKSPLGKIPCFTPKEGVHIPDSSVIIAYLERTHPAKPLYPENPEQFARALFLEEYADSALVQALAVPFFQRIIAPLFLNQKTDDAAIKTALETTAPPLLAWLEEQLGTKKFFVADRLTIADIALASPFVNFMHAGEAIDAKKYPNLARFLADMHERPSFKTCIDEERALFGRAA
jgi:glutathione S-transferase